ncbi:unnamed protein product [Plutella xylostella]|uniref:(diamondback moth) hypothetical protein n=1 Tax=Plutella xylostella TaxID=51655 RepID=A0A8S4D0U8_PLUXY|nr:unnamed protein product [Plutella xylostella]
MRRARSVTGPLRRAHPASGATWNVQVVRGKMSSTCLWHACRALSAGLLLMLLGAAMATIENHHQPALGQRGGLGLNPSFIGRRPVPQQWGRNGS